ncbi:hypothetical protein C9374_002763 [Naegleria lovaniensis]|uniref:Ubiquitin thioesterase OTU n=1 Tax=Naegleria lovaniensis TaxID=51637 RepID=A0AA88GP84_NAELO|nr:uncharacterized protein C9374_002763 [Naegleria lovaniensis]KAG2386317.1 hypothetical protein C9374_002763 [Naegleria lovaniensis]
MLRIRLPSGQMNLKGVDFQTSTVEWLKLQIQNESKIPPLKQKLKCGFPPVEVNGQSDQELFNSKKLSDIGLKSGESLIVEETNEYSQAKHVISNPLASVDNHDDVVDITNDSTTTVQLKPEQYSDCPARPHDLQSFDSTLLSDCVAIKRVIPADNSCLFNALAYCLEGSSARKNKRARALRRVVRDWIMKHPFYFNEAILGRPTKEYCDWIMKDDSWGGSIELLILSQFYNIRIESFDVTANRRDIYGEGDTSITTKIFLIYDGIHYDALAFNPVPSGPEELDITIVPANEEISSKKAFEIVKQLHDQHQFTDTASFTLKCLQCGEFLKGEKEATLHAKKTGHTSFGEKR